MKNHTLIMLFSLCAIAGFVSCEKEVTDIRILPDSKGIFVDVRDGFVYHYAKYGDTEWMLDNGHYRIDDDTKCAMPISAQDASTHIYTDKYVGRYGYCYTWSGAREACPEGWRVPTDQDWQKLEMLYGMSASDAQSRGWRGECAYAMRELSADSTTLGILMTGYNTTYPTMQTPDFRLMGCFGFFWTATADASKENEYFYRKFAYNKKEVWRESAEDGHIYFFVRYCRDAR